MKKQRQIEGSVCLPRDQQKEELNPRSSILPHSSHSVFLLSDLENITGKS